MTVSDIAADRVFLQSSTYAALAASNTALLPAQAGPVSIGGTTPGPSTAGAGIGTATPLATAGALGSLASYNSSGTSTVYGSSSDIGTLLNSLA